MPDKPFIFVHIPKCGGKSVKKALSIEQKEHECAWCVKNRISKLKWENQLTFAFVRNPYTRIASFYRYLKAGNSNASPGDLTFKQWFYLTIYEQKEPYCYKPFFFAPCWDWLTHEGELIVDFVGKVENMEEDFRHICNKLGTYANLPHTNRSPYERIVYSQQMDDIMKEKYHQDFITWYPNLL